MAPEQVVADPVDARTDVYGLGVVLFRMLTGHLPFDLDPGMDLLGHQVFSPTPPPSWLVDGLDPRLEQVILRCMRKHPENRYQSMDALLVDLEKTWAYPLGPEGEIEAPALARDPDVYKPRNPRGRGIAEYLAAYFGTDPPPPPSVELEASRMESGPASLSPPSTAPTLGRARSVEDGIGEVGCERKAALGAAQGVNAKQYQPP